MPVFGDIVRKNAISRFTRTLGTLLKSGVSILGALAIAKEAMGNAVLEEDVVEASAGVKQGKSLAEILRTSRTFPPMVVQMIAVGEEGGNLDEVLVAAGGGRHAAYDDAQGVAVMQKPEFTVRMVLGRGKADATVWTCDFSFDYVKINAEYRT